MLPRSLAGLESSSRESSCPLKSGAVGCLSGQLWFPWRPYVADSVYQCVHHGRWCVSVLGCISQSETLIWGRGGEVGWLPEKTTGLSLVPHPPPTSLPMFVHHCSFRGERWCLFLSLPKHNEHRGQHGTRCLAMNSLQYPENITRNLFYL